MNIKIKNGISPNIPVVAKMVRRLESDPLAEWMSVFCMYPEANFTIERVLYPCPSSGFCEIKFMVCSQF